MFAVLAGFDKPFNQAPSLHIALLVVLWVCYDRYLRSFHHAWRWLLHGWFFMIGLSVLTTWQHHFIDLPTGALAGWFCVWLWPDEGRSPLLSARLTHDSKRRKLAFFYALGAGLFAALAFSLRGAWLWTCWPAFSLLMVSLNYLLFDAAGFQKRADGGMSPASRWIFAPYRMGAWINSRLWTYRHPDADLIVDNVYLGRIPDRSQLKRFNAVVDMCAELPLSAGGLAYRSVPTLDLVAPVPLICLTAARVIQNFAGKGPILVCCALGYSRSATAVAAWLIHSGRASTVTEAVDIIRRVRPDVVIRSPHHAALTAMMQLSVESANVQ